MRFIFSGKNRELFTKIGCRVCGDEDSYVYYDDGLRLLRDITDGTVCGSVILLDFNYYKGFSDFIYDFLNEKNMKIPLLFIGNPAFGDIQAQHWIADNEFRYDIQTLQCFIPLFRRINDILSSPEIHKMLYGVQKISGDAGESVLKVRSAKKNLLEMLRNNTALPPAAFNLVAFLYKNRSREVSVDEIVALLRIGGATEAGKRNAAYSYISRLRKCMEEVPLCRCEVRRTRKGFYKLFLQ